MAEYIERKAALVELCRGCSFHGICDSFFCGEPCPKYERIAFIPAADVQPVRHGRWVYKSVRGEDMPCCSECGVSTGSLYEYAYCPNCGALMDKECPE